MKKLLLFLFILPLLIGLANAAPIIRDCPLPGADPNFCVDMEVVNVTYVKGNYTAGATLPITVTIKNNELFYESDSDVYIEAYVAPQGKVGYWIEYIYPDTHKCCATNTFYSNVLITPLSPQKTVTVTLYPKIPSPDTEWMCDPYLGDSAWNGYNDKYVVGISVLKWRGTEAKTCWPDTSRTVDYTWIEYNKIRVIDPNAPPTPPPELCGNSVCDKGETSVNCPADCPITPTSVCDNLTSGLTFSNVKADSYKVMPGDNVTVTATATVTKAGEYGIESGMEVYNRFAIVKVTKNNCSVESNFANKKQFFDVGTHSVSFVLNATEQGYNKFWVNKFLECGAEDYCGQVEGDKRIQVGEPPFKLNIGSNLLPIVLIGVGIVVIGLGYTYSKRGR